MIGWSDVFWLGAVSAFVLTRFVWPALRARRIRRLVATADEDAAVRAEARAELIRQLDADARQGDPVRPEVVVRLAELEIMDGLATDAALRLEALEMFVTDRPDLWQTTLLHLASACLAADRPQRAAEAASRAARLHPAGVNLAHAYLALAQLEQAQITEGLATLATTNTAELPAPLRARLALVEGRALCNSGRDMPRAEARLREAMRGNRDLIEQLAHDGVAEPAGAMALRLLAEQGPYR